jgi:PAS domain S-box-containing protein
MTPLLKNKALRKFGLNYVDDVPWGTHFCQFYETRKDLIDILVPYLSEGLRNNEFCIWITSPPLQMEEAKTALRETVPDLDKYVRKAQIELLPYTEWYLFDGKFDINRVLQRWVEKEKEALARGFDGLRLTENTCWIDKNLRKSFTDYEAFINRVVLQHQILALCTYSLERCSGNDVIDVVRNHAGTLIRTENKWSLVENSVQRKEADELHKDIIQTALDGFWMTDTSGNFLEVNDAYCKIVGYNRAELLKMNVQDVEAKENRDEILQHIQKLKLQGSDYFETRHRRKDGTIIDIEVKASYVDYKDGRFFVFLHDITRRKRNEEMVRNLALFPEQNPNPVLRIANDGTLLYANNSGYGLLESWGWQNGQPIPEETQKRVAHALATSITKQYEAQSGRDTFSLLIVPLSSLDYVNVYGNEITDIKKAEKALRESQIDLNRAQVVAKTGSWRMDVKRNVLLWSPENHRIFGVPEGTPMTYETFLGIVHPDDRKYVDRKWKAGLQGKPYDIEHRIIVNGKVKWVRERAELEFDKDGTLLGGFGSSQEITDLVKLRKKLEHYSKHLEDLVEEKTKQLKNAERLAAIGETAGMIGHDIRNPLQTIIGELYLLKDCLDSLPENPAKQELAESIRVLEEQTFYIDKIITDLQDYAKPLSPNIKEVDLESIVDSVLSTVDIPENIEITYSIEKGYQNLKIDSSYMMRILTNLVNNALQAMPDGGKLTINAYHRRHQVVVSVEDTGEGIPPEVKNKIFKPLFTTKAKGQGFGLPVVKKLISALNGTITFESEKGKGTKFIIKFPQKPHKNKT